MATYRRASASVTLPANILHSQLDIPHFGAGKRKWRIALIVRRIAVTLRAHAFQFKSKINLLIQGEKFQ
jgi:hypothetical protein